MNKRDQVLALLDSTRNPELIPAGFFLHFPASCHRGQSAVQKHLEFFSYTGMDFVKIQYEHTFPRLPDLQSPLDWPNIPRLREDFFLEPLRVVEGLVQAAKHEALVVVTLYSPFMVAGQINGQETITRHLMENPEKAKMGIEIVAEAMLGFVKACIRLGVDGFYASTQGAETFRFPTLEPFFECIKPYDLMVMEEAQRSCVFNILHICDYHGTYSSLQPFLDYPGHVVNCSLNLAERTLKGKEVSNLFERPFMGGLDRKGCIATGGIDEIRTTVREVLEDAPERYILAADCTVPSETPWKNLRVAIDIAHHYAKRAD
jgi:uroporphyrinogen decarboxylase